MLRRNGQKDIVMNGVTIKRGDFLAFPTFEPHMNPDIYSNPTLFHPDRYLEGREEDKKVMSHGELVSEIWTCFEIERSSLKISRTTPMCWDKDCEAGNKAYSRTHAPRL